MAMMKEQSELGLLISSSLPAPTRLHIYDSEQYYMPTYVSFKKYRRQVDLNHRGAYCETEAILRIPYIWRHR